LATAATDTAAHFSLVAYAHLAHFNSDPEFFDQHFYKLSKIYASLGCEKKSKFASIEGFFYGKEIHLQCEFANALQTKGMRPFFVGQILFALVEIFLSRQPENLFEQLAGLFSFAEGRRHHDGSETEPLFRFNDHMITPVKDKYTTVKIIYLACGFESYADYFFHFSKYLSLSFTTELAERIEKII
jgi:hypothetical protein